MQRASTRPKRTIRSRPVRLIVARCEVTYTGRLSAYLPESTRLLMLKADGSVLVHADAGGYKPLNWMTPPTVIADEGERIVVRKRAGKTEDRLEIRLVEVLSDVEHEMGEAAALEKDGVERDLQVELAARPDVLGEALRLVRREWPTDVGPVDLMCRDEEDGWVAVEIKRIGDDRSSRAARPLPRADPSRPGEGRMPGRPRCPGDQATGGDARGRAGSAASRSTSRSLRGEREPELTLFAV